MKVNISKIKNDSRYLKKSTFTSVPIKNTGCTGGFLLLLFFVFSAPLSALDKVYR